MAQSSSNIVDRIISSAAQGGVAAVVNAGLGAVAEPIVNTVLVKRVPVKVALKEFSMQRAWKMFYEATLPTNLIRFPFYEIVAMITRAIPVPHTARGIITGAVYTTATLPLGNYRFMKSMQRPIDFKSLWKAYLPTLFRDIVYSVARANVGAFLNRKFPGLQKSAFGQFFTMFLTALVACVISSPGNELRGYYLQQSNIGFEEFFQPRKYVRSTAVGATNIAFSLGTGALVIDPLQQFLQNIRSQPALIVGIALFVVHQCVEDRRARKTRKAITDALLRRGERERNDDSETTRAVDRILRNIPVPETPEKRRGGAP